MSKFVKYKDVIDMHCFGTSDAYNISANQGRFSSNGSKLIQKNSDLIQLQIYIL